MNDLRGVRGAAGLLVALVLLAGVVVGSTGTPAPGPVGPPPGPARVTTTPVSSGAGVNPAQRASATVVDGTLGAVALTADDGRPVPGTASPDGSIWSATTDLAYGREYRWSGTATGADGSVTPVAGTFRTVAPRRLRTARFNLADDATVGVAAPLVLQFDGPVRNRAAVQHALTVRMSQPNEGTWAWLPDTADGARIHFRPRVYWAAGTVVDVSADLFGVDTGDGVFGAADVTDHVTIGRNQVTRADSRTREFVVYRDGRPIQRAPASFGMGDDLNLVTRSGTHVVTDKDPVKYLSNPAYGYSDVYVRWAVRINNNGEFVHFNPRTLDAIGQQNLTHGCINIDEQDASSFYASTLVGDPVEVTGSPVTLSAADGDLYDWTIPWDQWRAMSADT